MKPHGPCAGESIKGGGGHLAFLDSSTINRRMIARREMSTTVFRDCVGVDIARSATNHLVTLIGTGFYGSDGVCYRGRYFWYSSAACMISCSCPLVYSLLEKFHHL